MFCRNCGRQLPDGITYCPQCGTAQAKQGYVYTGEPKPSVSFFEAIKLYFMNYANFSGRSRRSEYWWATLAIAIIGGVISAIVPELAGVWSLATLIPGIAVCVRRLHDIGKSGWWYLLVFLPLAGPIILLIWYCKDSVSDNEWGPNPKY